MLWLDKYCPHKLSELRCHSHLSDLLLRLASSGARGSIPHLLFYGPSGAGKKTRIAALTREIFGEGVFKVKADTHVHKETNTEIVLCQSLHHIQLSCPSLGTKDRAVIQGLLKEYQSSQKLTFTPTSHNFRVYVLHDAEALSDGAQAGLRRTVEKYASTARVFLHVNQLSNIIPALRSRCLCVRIPLPSGEEVRSVLRSICEKELISPSQASDGYLSFIAEYSQRNLRRAILVLENAAIGGYPSSLESLQCFPWETMLQKVVDKTVNTQSPQILSECRDLVYEVLTNCIPGQVVLEYLCRCFLTHHKLQKCFSARQVAITAAAHYSFTMARGDKPAFHVEAYIAHVIAAIKQSNALIT
eukprot:GHVS01041572.1.p1 GENE.GHVS01041572.1~~GHVS01041572.1.p1  ORF type:complete len:358 (+),score=31.04 GHVS01041572.1:108-1181(+)